jgi:hypothetical protein
MCPVQTVTHVSGRSFNMNLCECSFVRRLAPIELLRDAQFSARRSCVRCRRSNSLFLIQNSQQATAIAEVSPPMPNCWRYGVSSPPRRGARKHERPSTQRRPYPRIPISTIWPGLRDCNATRACGTCGRMSSRSFEAGRMIKIAMFRPVMFC